MALKRPDGESKDALDYNVIKRELDTLFIAIANKIEREWPENYKTIDSARELILFTVRIAINTFNTITYICADTPADLKRDLKFSLSVPPLNRTLLENVITLLFVLEDIPNHSEWFYKAGWREWKEMLEDYKRDYGSLPEWKAFIDTLSDEIEKGKTRLQLTTDEIDNTKKMIKYWPNPGKMPSLIEKSNPNSSSLTFMKYLNDWFYRELSGQSHLNVHGLVDRGMYFAPMEMKKSVAGDAAEEIFREKLEIFKNNQVWIAITLMMSLVSEIEAHFKFDLAQRVKYLWGVLLNYSDLSKEIYEKRYATVLDL